MAQKLKRTPKAPRQVLPAQDPQIRATNSEEVALGFSIEQAQAEALRCLNCRDPKCQDACPIHTDIRGFIGKLAEGDYAGAYELIKETNPFPGICGRVCQHELYCEKECLLGIKLESVAIGSLERFVADFHRTYHPNGFAPVKSPDGPRVALIGSGPASLICAHDLARRGYRVTIFEALHELGGVLSYGIPPFRLPRDIIREEAGRLRTLGVDFFTNFIVGKTATIDELFEQGYAAVFVGTGAGLPHMMGIPGENLVGVYTANEFLTRINLMHAYRSQSETPVLVGNRTVVIGGGNSAMDAARWAKRMGSESIIMFRRGRAELRARIEEIEHAEEEGVKFEFLAVPVRFIGDERGIVKQMECIRMELGEVDESGRRSPVPIEGSNHIVDVDTVVEAIGQSPNPIIQKSTPQLHTKKGKIVIDEGAQTSMPRVFAGGDVVRGGSTVILAMQDGRNAAETIDKTLRAQIPEAFSQDSSAGIPAMEQGDDFRIVARRKLSSEITWLEVHAPLIAGKWGAGQFVILRPKQDSERIPLTLVDGNRARGTITLIVQAVGKTSRTLADMGAGDCLADLLGPLGRAAHVSRVGTVVCAGGGVGVAELLPVARAFRDAGNYVVAICGARSTAHIILDEELRRAVDELHWSTDDGSNGFKGTVVDLMRHWKQQANREIHHAHVIGPIPMMRAASALTREWGVDTVASLNPIMVDGTGMCGGCRVTVDGKIMFACVDGPEFNAHHVDFDELTRRNRAYQAHESKRAEEHACLIGLGQ
jgi:glutamate synthase (NADPH/NADH) small chain